MNILYKLFKQDPNSREGIITTTSWLGIITNVLIATLKIVIGYLASSIAIISEGVNNSADVLTSVLTLAGTKLASRKPDEKHPFGYGRIEYLTGLIIATLILVTGIEMVISSIKLIATPEPLKISYISLTIVAVSAIIKYILGSYTIKMGQKADSSALIGVGSEGKSDAYASIITIVAAVVFLVWNYSIDAYAGLITSVLIIKVGYDVLMNTLSELIGRPGEKELADKLYEEIRKTPGIINAVDMMLHNYGPDAYSGSVNIEIAHDQTVGEIYDFIHELQLRIMHEYKVTMVFGVYAVDNKTESAKKIRAEIAEFIRTREHIKSYHAVYIPHNSNKIYCDFIVDYQLKDWEALRVEFKEYMLKFYPDKDLQLVIETEFV